MLSKEDLIRKQERRKRRKLRRRKKKKRCGIKENNQPEQDKQSKAEVESFVTGGPLVEDFPRFSKCQAIPTGKPEKVEPDKSGKSKAKIDVNSIMAFIKLMIDNNKSIDVESFFVSIAPDSYYTIYLDCESPRTFWRKLFWLGPKRKRAIEFIFLYDKQELLIETLQDLNFVSYLVARLFLEFGDKISITTK